MPALSHTTTAEPSPGSNASDSGHTSTVTVIPNWVSESENGTDQSTLSTHTAVSMFTYVHGSNAGQNPACGFGTLAIARATTASVISPSDPIVTHTRCHFELVSFSGDQTRQS